MKINAETAVYHIVNSLDNSNAAYWYDEDEELTWTVGQGRNNNSIQFTFTDDEGNEEIQSFRLVRE